MPKVGDRASLAIMGLVCCGTFVALMLTSVAKKGGLTGQPAAGAGQAPAAPAGPRTGVADFQKHFEEQLRQLDNKRT